MKKVLFVCIENSCRSQMAEGFARYYGGGKVEVASAGTTPASKVDEGAIQAMLERGIDISSQTPSKLEAQDLECYDLIVTMGCGIEALCPVIPAHKKRDWNLQDPKGQALGAYRGTRDQIGRKVKDLVDKLTS